MSNDCSDHGSQSFDTVDDVSLKIDSTDDVLRDDESLASAVDLDVSEDRQPRSAGEYVHRFCCGPYISRVPDEVGYAPPNDIPLWQLFLVFAAMGMRAFGGSAANTAMLKQELVVERRWISPARFNHVLAIYQILPGPAATQITCYFGLIARGRLGGVASGAGFILPGFVVVLLAAWLYESYGLTQRTVIACFTGARPVVAAMIVRACYTLGEHAFLDGERRVLATRLLLLGVSTFAATALFSINFYISLAVCGCLNFVSLKLRDRRWAWMVAWTAALVIAIILYAVVRLYATPASGQSTATSIESSESSPASLSSLFVLGVLSSVLTFGGAYATVPYVQHAAVVAGWLTNQQFLDALAVTSLLPAPLVMFVTFVGYIGASWSGAVVITVGMFIPAFAIPLVGHELFERTFQWKSAVAILDGMAAGVIGLLLASACTILSSTLTQPLSVAIFAMSLLALFFISSHRLLAPTLIVGFAIAGPSLFGAPPL